MKTLRVAVAGAGYFCQFQLDGWRRIPGVELVGICNRDEAKAKSLAERFGVPRVFGDLAPMLDQTAPDLVDIVTPPVTHRAYVEETARRRLTTICQKPFGRTHAEARALVDVARRAGIALAVHENFRFMPHFREMKRVLEAGQVGALHSIAFRLRPGDGQGPEAYLARQGYFQKMPRFLVFETAIHLIDTFRYLAGEVSAVTARLRRVNPAIAGEDAGYIIFEFVSGATGLFDGNRLNDHVAENSRRTMGECWLEGAAGVLRLDGDARLWWKPQRQPEAEHRYDRGPDDTFGGGACDALQAHVVRHLREGAPLENSGADYLANMRIMEAVYVSHADGRRIEIAAFAPGELR
ncbi:MAG: Gfo/Idh/MocA family oxidoreductase [Burkholderiales bacterium]